MERHRNKATGVILEPADRATAEMLARSEAYTLCPVPLDTSKRKTKAKEE